MAIFQRLGDIIKSNINDLLDRAENPEKMVKQIIIEMQQELEKCTTAYGQALAAQRQIEKKVQVATTNSKTWENKAKMAMQAGNMELAKQALERKVACDKEATQYNQMCSQITAQVNQIRMQTEALRSKLEEAKSRQSVLIARSRMAEAQKNMAKSIGNIDTSSAFSKLDRMEEKIDRQEAEANAFSEIANAGLGANDSFAQMEKDAEVNSEMMRLMQEMGMAAPTPAVAPAGSPESVADVANIPDDLPDLSSIAGLADLNK